MWSDERRRGPAEAVHGIHCRRRKERTTLKKENKKRQEGLIYTALPRLLPTGQPVSNSFQAKMRKKNFENHDIKIEACIHSQLGNKTICTANNIDIFKTPEAV